MTTDTAVPPALRVVNYAHRGASGLAPENTLAAFAAAATHHAAAVELDVRRTLDGHLVVMHDPTPARTTDVARVFPDRADAPVHAFTLAELRQLDAGSWFDARFAGERVPTLDEAMDVLGGHHLRLLLEAKTPSSYPGMAGQIAHILRDQRAQWLAAPGQVIVESFEEEFIRELRAVLPRVPVGFLGAPRPEQLVGFATFCDQINPHAVGLTAEYIERVHQFGMAVNVWTVDEPDDMLAAVAAGVDGIISNRPDLFTATFGASPQLN